MALFALWVTGWKIELQGDKENLNRCVLVVAPHTTKLGIRSRDFSLLESSKNLSKLIIKDAHTKAWYGWIVRKLGGIGIDRSQHNHLIEFITQRFKEDSFSLVVTPEGTRSRVNKWRMGFYHIALSAQVPVVLGGGDFKKKTIYIRQNHLPHRPAKRALKKVLCKKFRITTRISLLNILNNGTLKSTNPYPLIPIP